MHKKSSDDIIHIRKAEFMKIIGRVEKINNNKAYISLLRASACGANCESCSGSCETITHMIEVDNNINAQKGEVVEVKMQEKDGLRASIILYFIPFISLLFGVYIAYLLKLSEPMMFLFGIIATAITYGIIHIYDKNQKKHEKIKIEIAKYNP
ncbi:MAG: SoxR reducing system RseC family protein [Ezakiella sp.]|nr:SoxR reducing system RseC family protein [Ezakiella sp.]